LLFIDDILKRRSVAIVGLAKNAGKTEVLNYVLRNVGDRARWVAVTSIGVDGEATDRVTRTPKPEITIPQGVIFVTSEVHFRARRLVAEVLDVGQTRATALGRQVTARALSTGQVMLSGPSDTASLARLIDCLTDGYDVGTVLVDGALSRLSHGSPVVTEAMILVTGAAVSASIPKLVRETKYVYDRTQLPELEDVALRERLSAETEREVSGDGWIYIGGAVGEQMLGALKPDTELIIRDFTRIFAAPDVYYSYLARGGQIRVLRRSEVLAVCVNPTSPEGYRLDSALLREQLHEALLVPIYDVRECNSEML